MVEKKNTTKWLQGKEIAVAFALKRNAKVAKSILEKDFQLDKNFRMVPAENDSTMIALPIKDSFEFKPFHESILLGTGRQICPFSTKVMGNQKHERASRFPTHLSPVQSAILLTIERLSSKPNMFDDSVILENAIDHVEQYSPIICPLKLEIFGDDRTLVVPPGGFESAEFWRTIGLYAQCENNVKFIGNEIVASCFWKCLLEVYGSERIVRRGTIDANSRIRHSGHRLIYPEQGIPEQSGPGSAGWICVTEQGIAQSLDMTRVMFSRGNISEKIRFGKLVQEGEDVLDMYAGIGYYTLPAIIHGKARKVVACEWNKDAIFALEFNVRQNNVDDRVTILEGDCRESMRVNNLVDMFDRVSLGLLPSSEGGWSSAISALRNKTGGRLHIHGNVPDVEQTLWVMWICKRLLEICNIKKKPTDWVVCCEHTEKVKSFAPTVSHFVADVFVGPRSAHPKGEDSINSRAWMILENECIDCQECKDIPSCALSRDGVLSQTWMM